MTHFKDFFIFLILVTICLGAAHAVHAQDDELNEEEMLERIESLRIAILTETLELTPEQAAKFFPLYKEFRDKNKQIKQGMQGLKAGKMQKSEDAIRQDMKKFFALRREEINLEEVYFEKFTKVISARQAAGVYHAERKLRRMLLESIGEGGRRRGRR